MDRFRLKKQISNSSTATRSPPKHRHDGCSPLPLGMDSSPAPRQWNGLHTIWPHDPHTGWSYCATVPSWTMLPKAKNASGAFVSPIVLYKVQVGIQSPQGYSTSCIILRRFSDFLKLSFALKRTFPKRSIPAAPPKNSLSRINASHSLLEERRCALEDWLGRILGDIDISRSASVASFLELESATRSAVNALAEVQDSSSFVGGFPSETSIQHEHSSQSALSWECGGSSVASGTLSAAYSDGSATPKVKSETCLDGETESISLSVNHAPQLSNNKEGCKGDSLSNKIDAHECDLKNSKFDDAELFGVDEESKTSGGNGDANCPEPQPAGNTDLQAWHHRRPSTDSSISEASVAMASEHSIPISFEGPPEGSLRIVSNMERLMESLPEFDPNFFKGIGVVLPMEQRGKAKKIMSALQRRFKIAKSDMEDLLTRLNQETAMRDFLTTKAQDLESQLDGIHRKSKTVLQQALAAQRDRVTDLEWEVEECHEALTTVEQAFKTEQDKRLMAEEKLQTTESVCETLRRELVELNARVESTKRDRDMLETQARAELKVLAKEIRALRQDRENVACINEEKTKLEVLLQEDREKQQRMRASTAKLLHEVTMLHQRLKECNLDVLAREYDRSDTFSDSMELLTTSDNRIGLLLAEAQLLAQEDESGSSTSSREQTDYPNGAMGQEADKAEVTLFDDTATKNLLAEILIDNALLRKSINSLARGALGTSDRKERSSFEDFAIGRVVLKRFLS